MACKTLNRMQMHLLNKRSSESKVVLKFIQRNTKLFSFSDYESRSQPRQINFHASTNPCEASHYDKNPNNRNVTTRWWIFNLLGERHSYTDEIHINIRKAFEKHPKRRNPLGSTFSARWEENGCERSTTDTLYHHHPPPREILTPILKPCLQHVPPRLNVVVKVTPPCKTSTT